MTPRDEVIKLLSLHVSGEILIEVPPKEDLGDFAFACFSLAKERKKSPMAIAVELAEKIKPSGNIAKITATGPYVNFFLDKSQQAKSVLQSVYQNKDQYGWNAEHKGKTIAMDYSHPNIAKPFSIGHLRSTVIGKSILRLAGAQGYKTVGLNYLGDWGTQFGSLIAAFKRYGDEKKLSKEPILYLVSLYVKFHAETEKNPAMKDEAKQWFKKLEDGDKSAKKLWTLFRKLSIDDFKKVYALLDVDFDSYDGESSSLPFLDGVMRTAEEKKLVEKSDGAMVVPIPGEKAPCMLRKDDNASTYALRDLAAIQYRMKTYAPEKILYVVGNEQRLHFVQLFFVARQLFEKTPELTHINFGMLLGKDGKKMSTRQGKTVLMEEVIAETIDKVKKVIAEKNPDLANKDEVARQVGVGAIVFGDLSNDRMKDIQFDWDKILDFEGDTGPYIQYTHARACAILRKARDQKITVNPDVDFTTLRGVELSAINHLNKFSETIDESLAHYKPHILAQYVIKLARLFNEFYHKSPVLNEENERVRSARLLLVDCSRQVLKNSLYLLGMAAPERM